MPVYKKPVMTKTALKGHKIGDYTYGVPKVLGNGTLEIGKFCSIADGCLILLNVDHHSEWCTTYPFAGLFPNSTTIDDNPVPKGPVIIGNDVWIGQNVTILSGVNIGNGAVIGAGSIVTKNVNPYTMVAGNPAAFKKLRFEESWCNYINSKLKWWEWPIEVILENIDALLQVPGKHLFDLRKQVAERLKEAKHE